MLSELSSSKSLKDLPFPSKDGFNEANNLKHKERRLLTTCLVESKITIRDQLMDIQSSETLKIRTCMYLEHLKVSGMVQE